MIRITPRFKLLVQYNINPETHDEYFEFVTQEYVPGLQALGLYMYRVYHTAYGEYPIRQLEFLAEDMDTVRKALQSATWRRLEDKLLNFIADYSRKLITFREGFQI